MSRTKPSTENLPRERQLHQHGAIRYLAFNPESINAVVLKACLFVRVFYHDSLETGTPPFGFSARAATLLCAALRNF